MPDSILPRAGTGHHHMRVNTSAVFLLALLVWLRAAPAPAAAAVDNGLVEMAAAKRGAALKLSEKLPGTGESFYGLGFFISADGLALVNLSDLAFGVNPVITTLDGTVLPLGTILGVFPEPELALVKFKHRPKVWLSLAPKEPDTGEILAIPAFSEVKSSKEKLPPIVGPVMAKRSTIAGNLREAQFKRVLSLGAGMSLPQREAFAQGCFAINRQGELVAVKAGIEATARQRLILLSPLCGLVERIATMAKEGKAIPFPLPAASNPIDPVLQDLAYHQWDLALQQGDGASGQKHLADLRRRFPDNVRVGTLPGPTVTGLADLPRLDAKASAAAQVARLSQRGLFLTNSAGDLEGALREFTAALALCPKDYPDSRANLGTLHLQMNHPAEAEPLLREALALAPESIQLIEIFERMLTQKDNFDEATKFTDRLYELEGLYRTKY